MFLDVEITDNSFSFPGAKAAFFCCLVCTSEFGGASRRTVGERGLI